MMTTTFITGITSIGWSVLPVTDRWGAMRKFPSDYESKGMFYIVAGLILVALIVLLVWIQFLRRKDKKTKRLSFIDHVKNLGLSERDRILLLAIANKAELKQVESIFTIATAFDRGSSKVISEGLNSKLKSDEIQGLKTEISFLREKLGFKIQRSELTSGSVGINLSTRQIPVGKKLCLVSLEDGDSKRNIETIVEHNSDEELKVKLPESVEMEIGQQWSVQCYSGASVWQFNTEVISFDGNAVGLNHTSVIKLTSRRRYPRVSVSKPAFIAGFSFDIKSVGQVSCDIDEQQAGDNSSDKYADDMKPDQSPCLIWGPPEFVPAVVTELAGPGLRIESSLYAAAGHKVLIVLGLENNDDRKSSENIQNCESQPCRILEDIGVVRHCRKTNDGWSLAVELTGLSDPNVDELIRITNAENMNQMAAQREKAVSKDMEVEVLVQER